MNGSRWIRIRTNANLKQHSVNAPVEATIGSYMRVANKLFLG